MNNRNLRYRTPGIISEVQTKSKAEACDYVADIVSQLRKFPDPHAVFGFAAGSNITVLVVVDDPQGYLDAVHARTGGERLKADINYGNSI